jgi:hypothetical protein
MEPGAQAPPHHPNESCMAQQATCLPPKLCPETRPPHKASVLWDTTSSNLTVPQLDN